MTLSNILKISIYINLIVLSFISINAQTVNITSSNLPLVFVNTESTAINQDFKVGASMQIVYRGDGQITEVSDQNNALYLEYDGRVGINIRGSSSADFAKKQYSLELWDELDANNPQSFLNFPREHDFILQAPYIDKSLMRNVITYQLSNMMGQYAVRTKFCELILDGDYKGVYVLMERIKQDDDRIDVEKLEPTDNTLPNITGGYVWKVDKGTGGFTTAETDRYRFHDPQEENLTNEQKLYLQNELEDFEAIMNGANKDNVLTGYPSAIDVASWVDQFLLQEWTKNPDAFGSSMYYHKYRNGKLRMGPVWDLNLALGASYHGLAHYSTNWTTTFGHALIGPGYNQDLFNDATFECLMNNRWQELRQAGNPMNETVIFGVIDSIANLLNQGAQQRNFTKWNNLGSQVWLEAPGYALRDTYQKEVDYLKEWISDRLVWMDSNMATGTCPTSTPTGLVINEIMYNPSVLLTELESDFEFIEIFNNGNVTIDLTGIQLSMGIHYTFQTGSLAPGQFLILANNATKFQQRYGKTAFAEYEGNLSNGGERVVLADPYGFILDEVSYNDALPWPILADGSGSSLELKTPNLDNELAENWFSNIISGGSPDETNVQMTINCIPAPANIVINEINYNSGANDAGDWVELYNASGSSVDLSGWGFQDEGNIFSIPNGTTLNANAYLVLVEEDSLFSTVHSGINNKIGDFGFGLSGGGELISLVDNRGCLVDEVEYDDVAPWATQADGAGYTLQLNDANADNSIANNWAASTDLNGTPGNSNDGSSSGGGGVATGTSIKVFLEGFLNNSSFGTMKTALLDNSLIPSSHPYTQAPFNNNQTAFVANFPANTVDWILVEIRSGSNASNVLEQKSLLLRSDGMVMNTDGSTDITFNTSGNHYIAVYHRSHLGVLFSNTISLNTGLSVDFSTSINSADGNAQMVFVNGRASLFSGDFDNNGLINNLDYNKWSNQSAALNQYLSWDADGNGIVNNLDFNLWDVNKSKVGIPAIQK